MIRWLVLATTTLMLACGNDVTGPCAAPYACEVDGVDLALVRVAADSVSVVENIYGTPVVNVRDLRVTLKVVNRGSQPSPGNVKVAVTAFGEADTVLIAALAPGDSTLLHATLSSSRAYWYGALETEAQNITGRILAADANESNNTLNSQRYTSNIVFVGLTTSPDTLQTVRLNRDPLRIRWQLRVRAAESTPSEEGASILFCLRAAGKTCAASGWQALARFDDVGSGSRTTGLVVTTSTAASPAPGLYEIIICAVPNAFPGRQVDMTQPDQHCEYAGDARVSL